MKIILQLDKLFQLLVFIFLLFLLNILLVCQPIVFQSIYPVFTSPDQFGWTAQEQQRQAVIILEQMNSGQSFDQAEMEQRSVNFSASEVSHMNDVAAVLNRAKLFFGLLLVLTIPLFLKKFLRKSIRINHAQRFVKQGVLLYFLVSVIVCSFMLVLWPVVFNIFHELLFEKSTWLFPINSTLIRLFPDIFWQKTFLLVLLLPLFELLLILLVIHIISQTSKSSDGTMTP